MAATGEALSDSTVSRNESERIEREGLEAVREILALIDTAKEATRHDL